MHSALPVLTFPPFMSFMSFMSFMVYVFAFLGLFGDAAEDQCY